MNFIFFDSCDDFLKYYFENSLISCFTLVLEQFEKDSCYLDDSWISWCAVEQETDDEPIIIALIGFRKDEELKSDHITSFEVNLNYRDLGYGTLVLKEFIDTYCKESRVTLYSAPKNANFYKHLGFSNVPAINRNLYVKELDNA